MKEQPEPQATAGPDPSTASPQSWDEVERVLEDLAELAGRDTESDVFHQRLLESTTRLLAADGGAVWLFDDQGELRRRHAIAFDSLLLNGELNGELHGERCRQHDDLLIATLRSGGPMSVPAAESAADSASGPANPTDKLLVFCPLMVDDSPVGVIEVFLFCDRESPRLARATMEQLLAAIAEQAAEFHRRLQVAQLQQRVQSANAMQGVIDRIHRHLDLPGVGYAIANELRQWLGCDRVTVLSHAAGRTTVLAVSGVERVNRRAESVAALESLAQVVLHTGESLWHGEAAESEVELLEPYIDLSHASRIGILPLAVAGNDDAHDASDAPDAPDAFHDGFEVCGAVVLEQLHGVWPAMAPERAASIARHCGTALHNAQQHDGLPLLWLSRGLQRLRWLFGPEGRPTTAAVSLALAAILLAGLLIPAELQITARGRVQPQARARVFAPYDADVAAIETADGDTVAKDERLLMLRSLPLEIERDQVEAKLETAKARLEVIDIELVTDSDERDEETWRARLAAERREVELLAQIHQQRLAEIDKQLQELEVVSPIEGVVLSWMLEDLLADRPVTRGQHLLTVGKVDGPWLLELDVADHHIHHVHRARQANPELLVRFNLESISGRPLTGQIRAVAPGATTTESGRSVVKVEASIDEPPSELRPGAVAVANIRCGRTNLAYSLFHDLVDAVRSWLWI